MITFDHLCSICYGAGDPGVGVTCRRCGGSGLEDPLYCESCGVVMPTDHPRNQFPIRCASCERNDLHRRRMARLRSPRRRP